MFFLNGIAFAQNDSWQCDALKIELRAGYQVFEILGPLLKDATDRSGTNQSDLIRDISKIGKPSAENLYRLAILTQEKKCLDFNNKQTDWGNFVADSKNILDTYAKVDGLSNQPTGGALELNKLTLLERLAKLRSDGSITYDEFDTQKRKILSK